MISNFFSRL